MKKLFVLAVALIVGVAFALPAAAQDKAEWSWYGQARMWTAWEKVDEETIVGGAAGSKARAWNPGFGLPTQDDKTIDWQLQTNARLGVNVKWGNVGGTVEFGNGGTPVNGSADVAATFRQFFGTWNFGPGTLIVGKTVTPYFFLVSGLCGPGGGECNGIGFGSIYAGRRAQLTLQMGGLKVGLVEPETRFLPLDDETLAPIATRAGAVGTVDIDYKMPRIEASYQFNLGPAGLFVGGLYNNYDVEYGSPLGLREISSKSWALGIGARTAFGPFYANATGQYGKNVGESGILQNLLLTRMVTDVLTGEEEDSDYMAGQLVLGFKVMDSLAFEGGVVWNKSETDFLGGGGSVEQSQWVYYVQAQWSPAKNVFIVPEFGIIDNGDLKVTGDPDLDLGKVTWFGVKWQINF
jgi:hypothetical protein